MAFIGTLRNKMGTWVVVFVFVAIAAFILGDLWGGKSAIFKMDRNEVGEIGGHAVSLEEFQNAVKEREVEYALNFNREPGEREMTTLRQQAWELLILKYAIQPQYERVGLAVTTDEVWDMIQGKNVDENVKQAFTNPQTGQFDRDRVVDYLKDLQNPPAGADQQTMALWQEQKIRWEMFQKNLQPGRERIKYENLLIKSNYTTSAEAEREYHAQTDVAEVKFLYVPFYAVSDSSVTLTDADLNNYYNKHKEKYKTEENRSLSYVSFPVIPSQQDSADVKKEIDQLATDLKTSDDDSLFAAGATDGQSPYGKYNLGALPAFLSKETLEKGKVIGPFIDGNSYKVAKVSDVGTDTVFNARASHILIKWADASEPAKREAKEKARGILKDIKDGASFATMAREHGTDATANSGGDLGWFTKERMVKPFADAVFAANKPGLLSDVVETTFGYHVIDVTGVKDNRMYTLAVIEKAITPSDATTNEAYRKAEVFVADLEGVENFNKRAKESGLNVLDAKNITAQDRRIGNLGDAREIVKWVFNEGKKGKVSTIFDLQDNYVVAVMTEGLGKGYKPFDMVKEDIRPLALNDAKAKIIIEKLNGFQGSLPEIAVRYGDDANVYSSSEVKPGTNTLPTAGFNPEAIGVIFSLENGKRSKPFAGENGVLLIELENKTIAPAVADYSGYKNQLEQNAQSRSTFSIGEAIKANADIEDTRYKFY